ncbi:MAG: N(4)-(beta-N-acetylglucosaminyl)-L-asparaginase [Clostridia bacterium]|nr:N(4)-(beta-N-acetylglucosaminyl)-L-asparaginase [Clostridia bacterium]
MWGIISTWSFSKQTVEKAAELLIKNENAMDAAIEGVKLVESDTSVNSVGKGGFLNRDGALELDAAVMDGSNLKMGCVMGVKGFEHPVEIARAVMEKTKHNIIIGEGAERFAREMGIYECGMDALITDFARKEWEKNTEIGHDTIGAIALDTKQNMASVVSTSGANMKLPGRVGDSPIVGSGFYVENGVGGAAATGWGEDIMRTCLSFRIVDMMRNGMPPREACEKAVLSAHNTVLRLTGKVDCIAAVCMNHKGEYGAAANHKGFSFAVATETTPAQVIEVTPIIDKDEM